VSEVTSIICPECHAEIGEWCFDMEAKYNFPPYQYGKVVRAGVLLAHPARRRATTQEVTR